VEPPRKDAWIPAPAAIFNVSRMPSFTEDIPAVPGLEISEKDIIQMQQAEIRALREEIDKWQVAANTIANTAACLASLCPTDADGWVHIPRDLRQRMRNNTQLAVRHGEDDTLVRWTTRAPDHHQEGRADG
jgi:hypothetical protein